MNYVDILIPFVGGLGMFIYGMQIMAQGLENAAGSKMKSLLEVLTKNKIDGSVTRSCYHSSHSELFSDNRHGRWFC